ncbi:MAG: hypothetical protein WBM04_06900 [Candidatus Korobacteraceae bacterium]
MSLKNTFSAASVAVAAATTPEETLVRETYANAAFAVQVGILEANVIPGRPTGPGAVDKLLGANELQFTLGNFTVSNIDDKSGTASVASISSAPPGTVLDLSSAKRTFTQEAMGERPRIVLEDNIATAQWAKRQATPLQAWGGTSISMALTADHPDWWTRYATFTVTVRFKGIATSYRSYFLFGKDSQGNAVIGVRDPVTQGSGLQFFVTESVYPTLLLRTTLREDPAVVNWLKANQVEPNGSCRSGQVCCNPLLVKCGLLSSDLKSALSEKPVESLPEQGPGVPSPQNLCGDDCGGGLYCSDYDLEKYGNNPGNPFYDYQEHYNGSYHVQNANYGLTCTYTQQGGLLPDGRYPCSAAANASYGNSESETGLVLPLYKHVPSHNEVSGTAVGPSPTASAAAAAAIQSCLIIPGCNGISISFVGLSASFNPTPLWKNDVTASITCPYTESPYPSPIVIDLSGDNFNDAFTSVNDGVLFDFKGDGKPIQMSWTARGANVGFLVLDRNQDGKIDSAKEMFGNITQQPVPKDPSNYGPGHPYEPNGFAALSAFDDPASGGNGNGVIDSGDAVWPKLRVWVDTSHTGDSRFGKMYTLTELGIRSISLSYVPSKRVDKYGNQMRFLRDLASGARSLCMKMSNS